MKKIILTVFIAVFCAFSTLSALSWSGIVDNNSTLSANDDFSVLGLKQSNGIYLSLNSNLTETGNLRFSAEGLYKYKLTCNLDSGDATFQNIADCNLLKLSGKWILDNGTLSLGAGRFQYTDFSGTVFSQVSDGLYISYNSLKFKASLYGGYTGLLNRLNVSMIDNESDEDDQFYALCPKYIPVTADISYKALFDTNTIGLQCAAYIPSSDDYNLKAYGTLVLNGFFGTVGSYDARVTAGSEMVDDSFDGLMLDAKLDTNFYVGKNAMITAGGEYVSGNQGALKPFKTLSARSFGSAPFYNGVIVPKIGAMYAVNKLYANVTERVLLAIPEDEVKLDGFDTSVNVIYNLFSDVQLGCNIGAYICTEEKEKSNYSATIKASLAF